MASPSRVGFGRVGGQARAGTPLKIDLERWAIGDRIPGKRARDDINDAVRSDSPDDEGRLVKSTLLGINIARRIQEGEVRIQ
jgi:hypothetical protein